MAGDTMNQQMRAQTCNSLAIGLSVLLLLAGCAPRPPSPGQAPTRSAVPGAPAGATAWRLDAATSEFRFYLHADGPLASVGHTHVITAHDLRGTIWMQPQPAHSSCEIELPVASLVVDDPGERAAAGGEYAEPLDDDARAGTRDHMLGDKQLDAQHFPSVLLQCRQIIVTGDSATVELAVTLRGKQALLKVPARWRIDGKLLEVDGEFDFRQGEVGLTPYSLLFGSLRVADVIHARFRLRAHAPT